MKHIFLSICCMVCTVACGEKEAEVLPVLTGTIAPDHPEYQVSGEFTGYKAFAFDDQGKFWLYVSSNPNAQCADVVSYLQVGGDRFNPENVLSPYKCNILVKLVDWTGDFSASDDILVVAATAIECAMGEGTFELMTMDTNDRDYFWTGQWWQGSPKAYNFNFQGDRETGYNIDLVMSEYAGTFIYEEMDKYPAFGEVSGVFSPEICSGLASTGL